jgi:hypothetical protein
MKILLAFGTYLGLSLLASYLIVKLILNQEYIEDIGVAWTTDYFLINILYLPSVLIFAGLLIQNKIYTQRLVWGGFFTLFAVHVPLYFKSLGYLYVIISQVGFVISVFFALAKIEGIGFKSSVGLNSRNHYLW